MLTSTTAIPTRAQVTPETDLADLRAIKSAWIQAARDLDYPRLAWDVVRNLGKRVSWVGGYQGWLYTSGKVTLLGIENVDTFSEHHNNFATRRAVSAYVMKDGFGTIYSNPADDRIMNSHQVMYWAWRFYDGDNVVQEDESRSKSCIFIPGQWMNEVLRVQADAEAAIKAAVQKKAEADRTTLLAELLFGVEV